MIVDKGGKDERGVHWNIVYATINYLNNYLEPLEILEYCGQEVTENRYKISILSLTFIFFFRFLIQFTVRYFQLTINNYICSSSISTRSKGSWFYQFIGDLEFELE